MNKAALIGILIFLWLFCSSAYQAHADSPVIRFYQEYISPVDGNRCPMYPSCSSYAREAFENHGLFLGWVMTCDRLIRCGRDETAISPAIISGGQKYSFDPVRSNDFWWFEKKK